MTDLLIKNGEYFDGNNLSQNDILISKGKITDIGQIQKIPDGFQQINANGKLIFPGGIDPHVHLHLHNQAGFSADDFESGSKAAIAGGTTSLIDFVTPNRGQSITEVLQLRRLEAQNSWCDVKFHVIPIIHQNEPK